MTERIFRNFTREQLDARYIILASPEAEAAAASSIVTIF